MTIREKNDTLEQQRSNLFHSPHSGLLLRLLFRGSLLIPIIIIVIYLPLPLFLRHPLLIQPPQRGSPKLLILRLNHPFRNRTHILPLLRPPSRQLRDRDVR